jgi:pilus assembly protein Flp/PilA
MRFYFQIIVTICKPCATTAREAPMRRLYQLLRQNFLLADVLSDTEGVTAVEYGLIAALIAVVAVAALSLVGTNLSSVFTTVATNL